MKETNKLMKSFGQVNGQAEQAVAVFTKTIQDLEKNNEDLAVIAVQARDKVSYYSNLASQVDTAIANNNAIIEKTKTLINQ